MLCDCRCSPIYGFYILRKQEPHEKCESLIVGSLNIDCLACNVQGEAAEFLTVHVRLAP